MPRPSRPSVLCAFALLTTAASAHASVRMADTLTGLGIGVPLAGSQPDGAGQGHAWSTYYYNTDGGVVPSNQIDSSGAGFPSPATTGRLPYDTVRWPSGPQFNAFSNQTDVGAFINVDLAPTGRIVFHADLLFGAPVPAAQPVWAYFGATRSGYSGTPDPIGNPSSVGPWMLIRPTSNGTDVAELYATGGTANRIGQINNLTLIGYDNGIDITFDPAAGTVNADIYNYSTGNGVFTYFRTTPYQYATPPSLNGLILGGRAGSSASPTSPSTVTLIYPFVEQAPEPVTALLLPLAIVPVLRRRADRRQGAE